MPGVDLPVRTLATLSRDGLLALIQALAARGYQVLGPTVRNGAIVYDEIGRASCRERV